MQVRVGVARFEDVCFAFAFDLGFGVNASPVGIDVARTFGEEIVQFLDFRSQVDLGEAELTELESFEVGKMIFEQVGVDFDDVDSIEDGKSVTSDVVVSGF